MSQSSPLNDDSDSNLDRLGYTGSSLTQPQCTYHRFLAYLLAFYRTAYDYVQLPSSEVGYANEISALSTVFPGLYPFETFNPTSFPTRPLEYLDKAEDPPALSVGERSTAEPLINTQAPNITMFQSAHNIKIEGRPEFNNMVIRCGDSSLLVILVIIFICLSVFILTPGVYDSSHTTNPIANGIQNVPPPAITLHPNGMYDLGSLKPFVSYGAINGSFEQDRNRRVHPGTRERVLSQIKAWIDNPTATKHILWLHGPAGVGKSAIAQTITHSYATDKVPANFFFLHSDPDRNNAKRLFTTLAWQFASSIPALKDHISRSLIEKPDLPTKDVETQFQELIVRPFEGLSNDTRQPQLSDMVVVIDGIDECVDEGLQKRFLNTIGNVATNTRVPLRFFISSRPETHIQDSINRFKSHTLFIDLAKHADVDRDIEIYLKDQFDEIAKDQDIDPTIWPGEEIIQKLVFKASGQFLYASTVIGFIRDEENSAQPQLDIILGLKLRTTKQPFAELDRLYIAILERQSDQEFLQTFLALLVVHKLHGPPQGCMFSPSPPYDPTRPHFHYDVPLKLRTSCSYPHFREGYGILMDVSEKELRRKLSKMKSLLKIDDDDIDYHHRSFLEFLQDPSRSGQYNISTKSAVKQHHALYIDSFVRAAELVIANQPNYHPVPNIFRIFGWEPSDLDRIEDWRETLRPLLKFQDRLLNLPNITIPHKECTIFDVVHDLLSYISFHRLLFDKPNNGPVMPSGLVQNKLKGVSSMLTYFRRLKEMFDLINALFHLSPEVVVMKVHSWSEAQNLMDLIDLIVNGQFSLWSKNCARKATQLALEIHARVPVLPQFFLSTVYASSPYPKRSASLYKDREALSRMLLISNFLDHRYILPVLRIDIYDSHCSAYASVGDENGDSDHINAWQISTNPSYKEIIFMMLKLARAIQYFHSMGVVLSDDFDPDDIYVDSRFLVRISPTALVWSVHGHSLQKVGQRYESDIHRFGYVFCTMYFDTKSDCTTSRATRLSLYNHELNVPGDVWRLIQRCLSADGIPTIDEVVQVMESWKVELY